MNTSRSVARLSAVREFLDRVGKKRKEEGSESGFTLIELMVVLLIMAILLAIAIPTFLGVTAGAKVTAAQSDLTNAMITAKATYTNGQKYTVTATLIARLKKTDPALSWTATTPVKGQNSISVATFPSTGGTEVVLTAEDSNGGCWILADNESSATTATATGAVPPGEGYGWLKTSSTDKCKAATAAVTPAKTAAGKTSTTEWKTNFKTLDKQTT